MKIMDSTLSNFLRSHPRSAGVLVGSSIAATLAAVALAKLALSSPPKKLIRSPREVVLRELSKAQQDELAYPPDVFPGARDIPSPYGNVRVYEFGPESGKKVLLLHGITTPCVALGGVAHALVERGCRVMIMDFFGRGYSDSPADLPHDVRLYCTQILLAITSSPLTTSWTSPAEEGGFALVGYSLGGGIAADFATRFPGLVRDLVLLAPAGLIRAHHFGWGSRFLFSSLVPDALVHWLVKRRLKGGPVHGNKKGAGSEVATVVSAEIKGNRDPQFERAPLSKTRPGVTVASAVSWQVQNHEGFVVSFVSSVKFAPIEGQVEVWKKLGERQKKVLIIAGETDSVIVAAELKEDAVEAIGEDKLVWKSMDGGHEFPITMGEEVARLICESWGL